MRIVTRSFLRYIKRRRGLSFLQLMGIACGVAAVTGMTLSSRAALSSFTRSVDFLGGRATHSISRPAGPMDETILADLVGDGAVRSFSPVIDSRIRIDGGDLVRLFGIDPFLDSGMRPEISRSGSRAGEGRKPEEALSFIINERRVLLDHNLSESLGVGPGGKITTNRGTFTVEGTFPNPSGEPLVLMDISHAQELLGMRGRIDRVDLVLDDEEGFRSRFERGFVIQSRTQRRETLGAMLRAFSLNLQALSLLALFVGVFLIYNTAMFAVVSRRRDAGILAGLGAGRHEIAAAFLTEILLLGTAGGALGGVLGYLLSRFLTGLIGGTISNLYFFLRPEPVAWSFGIVMAGVAIGCLASLLGAFYPLWDLVRTAPIEAISGRVPGRKGVKKAMAAAIAGLVILAVSLAILPAAVFNVYIGFAGAFGFLIGMSFLSGMVIILVTPALRYVLRLAGGLPGKVAAGFIRRNLSRTAVAVAAFMVALSMSIGLGSMISSFRKSLLWWMDTQLTAEFYVGNTPGITIPEELYEEIRAMPGVGGVDVYRNVQIIYEGVPVYLASIDATVLQKYTRFGWLEGGDENWDPVKTGDVVVSESFFRRFGHKRGDRITLEGLEGQFEVRVAGVFYDYSTEHGVVMMDRSAYIEAFGDRGIGTIGIFMDKDAQNKGPVLDKARKKAEALGLPIFSRGEFHDGILEVFDSTFAVTKSMRTLAIIIALFGIAGALLTLFMERQREFGIYRALGFSTYQVAAMTIMEGLGLGLVSFILGAVTGTVLAFILIKVINLRSFNWTVFFYPEWRPYLFAAVTTLASGIAASAYPVLKVFRTYPEMQIREE